jgi:1,4-dihydroxy-6-naphthoate synthase
MGLKNGLDLAFSPCPNDTFIFNELVNGRLPEESHISQVNLADVEALNKDALEGKYAITKLSFGAIPYVSHHYQILDSGSAMGFGCGPLLVSRNDYDFNPAKMSRIAIPGEMTTAYLLFRFFFPNTYEIIPMRFDLIEQSVMNREVDAGLIIHESRFTFEALGLKKVVDLGQLWETKTGLPIPLGCIAIRRSLDEELKMKVNEQIRESVKAAFAHPEKTMDYVRAHAQSMDEQVMLQHIGLYVNEYSISLKSSGRNAILQLFEKTKEITGKGYVDPLFIY